MYKKLAATIMIIFIALFIKNLYVKSIEKFVFVPNKMTIDDYKNFVNDSKLNFISCDIPFATLKKTVLHGGLMNKLRYPSWDDKIILYSHGNGGNIQILYDFLNNTHELDSVFDKCSIFIYDYRGYGYSDKTPSEKSVYQDIENVWNYLTKTQNVKPSNIILYGCSLGTSITTHFAKKLIKKHKIEPMSIILESPFMSVKKLLTMENKIMSPTLSKILAPMIPLDFNNIDNLEKICKISNIKFIFIHSREDDLLPIEHSRKMYEILSIKMKHANCKFIEINGSHNSPIYESIYVDVVNFLKI